MYQRSCFYHIFASLSCSELCYITEQDLFVAFNLSNISFEMCDPVYGKTRLMSLGYNSVYSPELDLAYFMRS